MTTRRIVQAFVVIAAVALAVGAFLQTGEPNAEQASATGAKGSSGIAGTLLAGRWSTASRWWEVA